MVQSTNSTTKKLILVKHRIVDWNWVGRSIELGLKSSTN